MLIYGINPVTEALRAGRVTRLRVADRSDTRLKTLLSDAGRHHVEVSHVDAATLDRLSRNGVHQGVVADVEVPRIETLDELIASASGPALLVVLDGVEDPHNVGAIVRTVDAAGAHGVVRQTRRAAAIDGVAAKASAGAVSHVPIVDVVNISRALTELKELGVWTIGLAGDATESVRDRGLDAAERGRSRRGGRWIAAARSGDLRSRRVDPAGGTRREPECLSCRWCRTL